MPHALDSFPSHRGNRESSKCDVASLCSNVTSAELLNKALQSRRKMEDTVNVLKEQSVKHTVPSQPTLQRQGKIQAYTL